MLEQEIIQGCRDGNPRAQKALVDTYSRYLFGVCRRYIKEEVVSKDCLQESLLHILTHLDSYEEQGKFKAWMSRITVLKCLQCLRKEKKHRSYQIENVTEPKLDEDISYKLEVEDIMKFMDTLPEQYRIALNMYLIEGYKHKEIAKYLEIGESSSRALVSRGRKMINDRFKEERLHVVHKTTGELSKKKISLGH